MRSNNRSMSSMSRLPIWCSAVPTHRNSSDFAIAWNSTRKAAAQTASGVPTPAQATIKPRFAMVEYASTRLAFDCEMAMNEQNKNVRPPTRMTMTDGTGHAIMMGASLMSKKTPAFTMVEECSSADVGVGATMAPRSHVWNGICAALVRPANASAVTGSTTMPGLAMPICRNSRNDSVLNWMAMTYRAARKAMPPSRFMMIWRKAFLMASSVRVKPMRRKEHTVVISQPVNSHSMLFENTMRNMAARKTNMRAKNVGRRSFAPSGSCAWKSSM